VDSLVKELDSLWAGRTLDKGAAASLEKIRPKKTNISVLEKELDSVISRNKLASKTVTKQEKAVPLTESEIARAKAKQRAISTSLEREATELGFSKKDVQGAVIKLNERGDFDFVNHISGKDLAGIKKNLFRQRFQSEVNLNDILELRKSLPDFDTQQRQVAAQSIEAVDNWLNSLKPEQVSGKFLKETLSKYRTSNTAYQQLKKNNDVLGVIASSKGDALAMKSGFQRLLTEAKKRGGYSKQELSALEDLTKTAPINLAIIGFNSSVQKGMSKTWALLQAASILTLGKLNISPLALGGIATGLGYGAAGLNKYITNLVTKSTIAQKASMYARLMRSGQLDNYRALIPDTVSTLEKAWRMSRPAIVNDLNEMEAQENVQGMLGL
jgi:hypothetical protein